MSEHLLAVLRRIESLLTAAEKGVCSAEKLLGPLWQLTGATCMRGDWIAGEPAYEWNDRVHRLRDGISYAVRTGKPIAAELARVRRVLTPLFGIVREIRSQEECCI